VFGVDLRVARAAWTVALVALALYCVYTIRATLLVMVFAIFFSYVVYPLFEFAQRHLGRRLPRNAVLGLVFAVVVGAIVLAGAMFGNPVADQASSLGRELPRLLDPDTLARRLPLPGFLEPFRARLLGLARSLVHDGQWQALPAARQIGAGLWHVAGNLVYVVVIPIASFLMISQAPLVEKFLVGQGGGERGTLWVKLARDLNFLLSRYVRALALLSLATLVSYGIVLSLLGAPFALLLAGVAAVLEVIPVFGPLAAALAILSVAAFNDFAHVWWLFAFVLAYRIFQDYMLNPWLMSEGVHVPPILVVFGLLAGNELAGVAGIFLSIPLLAAARIVIARVRADRAAGSPAQPPG
jgi:predicted PurR-regulated permease PerM